MMSRLCGAIALLVVAAAGSARAEAPAAPTFGHITRVTIRGYTGDAMEPFISADGKYLFFNNRNASGTNTDLFYARRANGGTFTFAGKIRGANGPALDAVASLDTANAFFFVSTRSYDTTLSTIYRGTFANGAVSGVSLVPGVSNSRPGWVNFDADVSADGQTMYFVDSRFHDGQPATADLVIAKKAKNEFTRAGDSARVLARVNTTALEYGASVSANGLDLFFTRAPAPLGSGAPAIYVATRRSRTDAFGTPRPLANLSGFVEAPAVSADGRTLYFHKLVNKTFAIYRASMS